MGEAQNGPADHDADPRNARAEPPPTVEALADLQAGLLDDEAAAALRRQVREYPDAERILRALNRVRRDVAAVGADPESAPEPPAGVTRRISGALRSAGDSRGAATHAARPRIRGARVAAGAAGVCAVLAAIGFGTAALLNEPGPAPGAPTTALHITVSTPPMAIPLSAAEIVALLGRAPDYGPLGDPGRRASCLGGLGYPASTQVLGARPVEINARPGVLLVLPGDNPADLAVFAVALNCSAADTGLLASTQVARP
ncbi:hypothetical protein AWC29_28860 [Mycobacterium triplex]|uniref:Hypothetical alanine rich protein n=1 Tax=Mycobacterium triplex TaxID=47839 RepID=A0A024JR49_9MYCO|nr:hypothetical protein [Mycobacterium triplex]ORW99006.1 hypothetical protein AWC29_28860 [Mycobacterium triplex]CDO86054.1 hypothetical alanine rich protein [Mycobacterium triplex]